MVNLWKELSLDVFSYIEYLFSDISILLSQNVVPYIHISSQEIIILFDRK